jgi:guanylate kinase
LKRIFLIDGAAGTGKSDLLRYISKKYAPGRRAVVLNKVTTRAIRPEERGREADLDLTFLTRRQYRDYVDRYSCYQYEYGDGNYAIRRADIDSALRRFENVFVIVRDINVIRYIRHDYPWAEVVSVYVHADRSEVRARLKREKYDDRLTEFRLARFEPVWNDYLKHSDQYDVVLVNNSNRVDYQRLIDRLIIRFESERSDRLSIDAQATYDLPAPLIGYKDAIERRIQGGTFNKNVFVMMKYRDSNRNIYDFIARSLRAAGLTPVRADDPSWNITDNVYNPIAVLFCCRYGIALFDEPEPENSFSPNVAYELGMMHLQRKKCLILRHATLSKLPFDLIKDLHVSYTKVSELRAKVGRWVGEIRHAQSLAKNPRPKGEGGRWPH